MSAQVENSNQGDTIPSNNMDFKKLENALAIKKGLKASEAITKFRDTNFGLEALPLFKARTGW